MTKPRTKADATLDSPCPTAGQTPTRYGGSSGKSRATRSSLERRGLRLAGCCLWMHVATVLMTAMMPISINALAPLCVRP